MVTARMRAAVQVIGLLVLGGAVLRQVEWGAVAASYRGVSPGSAAAIVALVLAAMGLRLWKWAAQVRAMRLDAPAAAVARGYLLGVLLGAVTPLRVGELYRIAAATAGAGGEARGRAAAGVVLDKGYELLVVLATLAVGAVLVGMPLWTCAAAGAAAGAVGWLVLGPTRAPAGAGALARARGTLAAAKRCLGAGERARLLGATAGAHALNVTAGLLIWRAFGALSPGDFVVRIPLVTLINTLPVTIGGFGLRELAAIELFGPVGFAPAAAAVAAAALFFAANVLPALALLPLVAAAARRRT